MFRSIDSNERVCRAWLPAAIVLGLLAAPADANAQDSQTEVARRDLISRAETARDRGNHEEALALAQQAGQIRMSPSLRLMVAQEQSELGHPVEALSAARDCVREVEADDRLRHRDRLLTACRSLVSEIEPRLGRLVVHVESPRPNGLRIRIGDVEIPTSLIDVPTPLAAGAVTVHAEAGTARFEERVTVRSGQQAEITIRLDSPPPPPVAEAAPTTPQMPSHEPTLRPSETRGPGVVPWVVVGVGGLSMAASIAFYVVSIGARNDRDRSCDASGCDVNAIEQDDRYRTFNTAANVAFFGGTAVAVSGVAWWLLGQPGSSNGHTAILVTPTDRGWMLGVGGSL